MKKICLVIMAMFFAIGLKAQETSLSDTVAFPNTNQSYQMIYLTTLTLKVFTCHQSLRLVFFQVLVGTLQKTLQGNVQLTLKYL